MTNDHAPSTGQGARKPVVFLVIGVALALVGIAVLWPLQYVGQVCVMIYPAPPGCGAPQPAVAALGGIALLIALLAAEVVFFVTAARPRVPLILLSAGMVAVVALAAAIVALSQTGIWDPYQGPIMID